MALTVLSLAATLWAAVTPAPASPQPAVEMAASTYDEGTCASLHAGDDDWAHAAIGEATTDTGTIDLDCQSIMAQPTRALTKIDCDEPAPWPGRVTGTCAIPRNGAQHSHLRAANDRTPRHTFRLLAQADTTPPLSVPPTPHEIAPLHLSALPVLAAPTVVAYDPCWTTPSLRSISHAPSPRPPEA